MKIMTSITSVALIAVFVAPMTFVVGGWGVATVGYLVVEKISRKVAE